MTGDTKASYREYFDEIYSGPCFASKFVVLSHEPINIGEHFINVHGHLHNSKLDDDIHINLGYKCNNYKMFNLKDAHKLAGNLPRIKAHFLEEWYADKYVFIDKFDRRNCFFYRDTGHIVEKSLLEYYFKSAKSMIYGRMFEPDQKIADYYKERFDEYFSNSYNRTTVLNSKDSIHNAGRKILNTFIEGEGLSNEILLMNDKLYGIYYFFTDFSGRCMDRKGALIEFEALDGGFTYRPIRILVEDHGLGVSKLVKFNFEDDYFVIEDKLYNSLVSVKPLEMKDTGFQMTASVKKDGNQTFNYLGRLFYAADEDSARLQYELIKEEGPF